MPVHNLGYRRWHGRRTAGDRRWWVIASTGIRLAWRSHWLRRMLLVAWLPAVSLGALLFTFEQVAHHRHESDGAMQLLSSLAKLGVIVPPQSPDPASARHEVWSFILLTLFRYPQSVLMVLLVGILAPPLIASDLRTRAYLLYFSRPLGCWDYVLGKSLVVWTYLFGVTALPALALYALGVALSPSLRVVLYTWDLPLRILAASVCLILPTTALALCFSSMTSESRNAGFAWFATWVLGWVAYSSLTMMDVYQSAETSEFRKAVENLDVHHVSSVAATASSAMHEGVAHGTASRWTLVSLYHTLGIVQSWAFGIEPQGGWGGILPAIGVLVVLTAVALAMLAHRVSAPLRV